MSETAPAWAFWVMFAAWLVEYVREWVVWGRLRRACAERDKARAERDELQRARAELYEAQVGERFAIASEKRAVMLEVVSVMEVEPSEGE